MGTFGYKESIDGDLYVQKLSTYIRRNEEALANGLLAFSKTKTTSKVRPLRISFTLHHLYYVSERIDNSNLDVDVGPLNIKLDIPNVEPTFILFMANNARSSRNFDNDTRSVTSIGSVKSLMSTTSVYWRSFGFGKDVRATGKDIKYLYSSFTKIPCLILTPKTKVCSISTYEEYPCDTLVPLSMFKNLQVLEINEYEPNEIFGWHVLSKQLRILVIKNSKVTSLQEILFNLVIDDESGRSSFDSYKYTKKFAGNFANPELVWSQEMNNNSLHRNYKNSIHQRIKNDAISDTIFNDQATVKSKSYDVLDDSKWGLLKHLAITDTSISSIESFVFKPLNNLLKLILSGNLLEELPEGLDQLTNIRYLNFSDNYLTSLKNLPTNLRHLVTLNFSNNKLRDIEGLEKLPSLAKIDLRRNKLTHLNDLKPIVLLYEGRRDSFSHVYLSGNELPRNYRIDLFNLFNGVTLKSRMKIDESRPGYFESALLLDANGAQRFLNRFLGKLNSKIPDNEDDSVVSSDSLKNSAASVKKTFASCLQVSESTSRTSKEISISSEQVSEKGTRKESPGGESSVAFASPLSNNQNYTNTPLSLVSRTTKLPQESSCPSSQSLLIAPGNMRRSSTHLYLEPTANHNVAPNVISHVQVTARMSS